MTNISSKKSGTLAHNNISRTIKPAESIETAGSLAMGQKSLFATNIYDMFSSSNPFAVDYTQYADLGETIAYDGGFLGSFSNAVSTLSSSSSEGGSFATTGGGGFSGASCCSGGGFSSVC